MKIFVKAKPNSKENKIIQISENSFIIQIKSPPINDLANQEIIKILSDYFKVNKSSIKLIKGRYSKNKVFDF